MGANNSVEASPADLAAIRDKSNMDVDDLNLRLAAINPDLVIRLSPSPIRVGPAPRRPLSKQPGSFETNADKKWRQINMVERPKRAHYELVSLYRELRDQPDLDDVEFAVLAALFIPAKVYKHLGQHKAIEVLTEHGPKYWDADKGPDGYLRPRSGFWPEEHRKNITKRTPLGQANFSDMESDELWDATIDDLNQIGPYSVRKNNCRDAVAAALKKYIEGI